MSAAKKDQALTGPIASWLTLYMNVQFIDLYDAFLDEGGQLRPSIHTTDGPYLTIVMQPCPRLAGDVRDKNRERA